MIIKYSLRTGLNAGTIATRELVTQHNFQAVFHASPICGNSVVYTTLFNTVYLGN